MENEHIKDTAKCISRVFIKRRNALYNYTIRYNDYVSRQYTTCIHTLTVPTYHKQFYITKAIVTLI